MKLLKTLIFTATAGLLTSLANAGTLTINTPPGLVFSTALTDNTIGAQLIGGNLIKISGTGTFTQPSETINSVTLSLSGSFSVVAGEILGLDYDFSASLDSEDSVPYTISAIVTVGFFSVPISDNGILDPGSNTEQGTEFYVAPFDLSGTFSASIVLDTSDMAFGDTLTLTIPTNSIDLSVIPEPSTYALIGFGMLGIAVAARRRKVTA